MRLLSSLFALLLLVTLVSGCAASRETAEPTDQLVGTWQYALDTPQGDFGGRIVFEKAADQIQGTLTNEIAPAPSQLENIQFDGSALTFEFDGGEYGRISANLVVDGDQIEGVLDAPAAGGPVPLEGSRVTGS